MDDIEQADHYFDEADVLGFVRVPCQTCWTYHVEGECLGPWDDSKLRTRFEEIVDRSSADARDVERLRGLQERHAGHESVADRAERLAARHTRYDGSPR